MLVLSRHEDESIIIGEDILITVVEIRAGLVRLGVEAPREIRVDRLEIRAQVDRERTDGGPGPRRTGRGD